MPYIAFEDRLNLEPKSTVQAQTTGELTFQLTHLCQEFVLQRGGNVLRFEELAQVIAALEATKLEFYRRIVAPYEDLKIKENGDVY